MTDAAQSTTAFDRATAVEPADGPAPGRSAPVQPRRWYHAHVREGWDVGGVANGGYMMAIAVRAMAATTERSPLSVTAHYLAPGAPGPCDIDVTTVRTGRRMSTVDALVIQGGTSVIKAVGTFGGRAADARPSESTLTLDPPADLPGFDECLALSGAPTPAGLPQRLDVRIRPGDEGFAAERPTGRAEVAGWFALADAEAGHRLDPFAVILAADAFFPAIFNSGITPAWVPTLELTVHLRAEPAPGPIAARFQTDVVEGGMLNEDGVLWDVGGTVIAQSRQLALLPR